MQAIKSIWHLKTADTKRDVKRALQIWKDISHAHHSRTQRLSIVIKRQEANYLRQAFLTWQFKNLELDSAVRTHILTTDFSCK